MPHGLARRFVLEERKTWVEGSGRLVPSGIGGWVSSVVYFLRDQESLWVTFLCSAQSVVGLQLRGFQMV